MVHEECLACVALAVDPALSPISPKLADTLTLAKLDRVIQAAMGWTNCHLHEFEITGQRYCIPDDEWPDDNPPLDDRRSDVGTALGDSVGKFTNPSDFGDHWQHTVMVEKHLAPNKIGTLPPCLAGQSACPPEDVGGIGGYMEFLEGDPRPHARRAPCHVALVRRVVRSGRLRRQRRKLSNPEAAQLRPSRWSRETRTVDWLRHLIGILKPKDALAASML